MRFDSVEHVDSWRQTGRYPAIHKPIADFVVGRLRGPASLVDLCCSHGLLGDQLLTRLPPGTSVVGVESSLSAIGRARDAGLRHRIERLHVDASTYDELAAVVRRAGATVLIARRCLPEILGAALQTAPDFARALFDAGIREVFLQGRVVVAHPTNPLFSVDKEVEALSSHYGEAERAGQLSHLRAR